MIRMLCGKKISDYWFNRFGGILLILNSDFQVHNLQSMFDRKIPMFYVEIIGRSLIKAYWEKKLPVEKNILWHNQYIVFNKRPLFYKEWFNSYSGVVRLEDILTVNGGFKGVEEILAEI